MDAITSTVAVQIVNNKWQLTAPTNEPASDFQVGTMADQLKKLQASRVLTETDLTKYGLDTPVLTVTLVVSGAQQTDNTLLVGKATIDGGSYYVKNKDKPEIYVVLNSVIEQLRSWLTTPPKAEPTPTPLVIITPSPTPTETPTPGEAGPVKPTGGRGHAHHCCSPRPGHPDSVTGIRDQGSGISVLGSEPPPGEVSRRRIVFALKHTMSEYAQR